MHTSPLVHSIEGIAQGRGSAGQSAGSLVAEVRDFVNEIHGHLQSLNKEYLEPNNILEYLNNEEVLVRIGRKRPVALHTANKWMKAMGYRYGKAPSGMYIDGHEREDVVAYREKEFLPLMKEYEKYMVVDKCKNNTELEQLNQLRNLMIHDPTSPLLQPMIQQIAQQNPELAQYIQSNPISVLQRPLILVTHDESTFYANDQQKQRWIHDSETAKP